MSEKTESLKVPVSSHRGGTKAKERKPGFKVNSGGGAEKRKRVLHRMSMPESGVTLRESSLNVD